MIGGYKISKNLDLRNGNINWIKCEEKTIESTRKKNGILFKNINKYDSRNNA